MDIIIVTIVSAFILYYLYGNPTKRKYHKGIDAFKADDLDQAEHLFAQISNKHPSGKRMLDSVTFRRGELAEKLGDIDKAYEYFSIIRETNQLASEKLVAFDLKRGYDARSQNNFDLAYTYFSRIANRSAKAFSEASKIDFRRGIGAEQSEKYSQAIEFYLKGSQFKEDPRIHLGAICRSLICKVKDNQQLTNEEISMISSSSVDINFKNDLFYRLAAKLIRDKDYLNASGLIQAQLALGAVSESVDLFKIIDNSKRSELLSLVNTINTFLSTDQGSKEGAEDIYKQILRNQSTVDEYPEYAESILEVKTNLFGKLIQMYFKEENFEKCLDHILDYPHFYAKLELLKNAGLCCVKLAIANKINDENYKRIIPIWLTAIYTDDIFIESLDSTTWDDDYSFTIADSLGKYSKFLFQIKVENINRDAHSETNISIGQAQRELLSLFENSLNAIQPEKLNNSIYSFYSKEKESIAQLTKTLGYDIPYGTPEFAQTFGIDKTILKHLQYAYEKNKNESVLELGAKYVRLVFNDKGGVQLQTGSDFEKYASSMFYSKLTIDHVKGLRSQNISDSFKDVIGRYDSISENFEEQSIAEIVRHQEKVDVDAPSLIQLMENVLKLIPFSEKLRYLLAEYITTYCIDRINSKAITETKGLELLVKGIVASPENHRTAKNLAILVSVNLMKTEFREKVSALLPTLRTIESDNLYESLIGELSPVREELAAYLGKPNVDYSKVRDLIKTIDELIQSIAPKTDDDLPY